MGYQNPPPDERPVLGPEYDAWLDELNAAQVLEPEPTLDEIAEVANLASFRTTKDPLNDMLAAADRCRLHTHNCWRCGRKHFGCLAMPCEWRPFDKNQAGDRWHCPSCRGEVK